MTRTALKKVENAGGKDGVEASPTKGTPRKRKTKGDADDEETKPKKKRGKQAKKSPSPAEGTYSRSY